MTLSDFSGAGAISRLDIELGLVPGFELLSIAGESPNIGKAFTNLTPTGGSQTLASSAETWEILSTDANDNSSGTGSRSVVVFSLNSGMIIQTTAVATNGTTPVTLSNTHLRSRTAVVATAGSGATGTNIGDIIIRVSGGGTERMRIPAGVGDCKSLIYTVETGKTVFPQSVVMFCAKNQDGRIKPRITPEGGATVDSGIISAYQSGQTIPVTAPQMLTERTDVIVDCQSTNENTRCLTFISVLQVDNDKLSERLVTPLLKDI